jgi:KDO2-lipid IV(A) lauroyltransferase
MRFLGFICTYTFLWLLHLLPESILFQISNFFYFITYHVAGYRKKVVFENISRAFPEYDEDEVKQTARKFYRHLCDLILESAVYNFYSERKAKERMEYVNPEVLEPLYKQGKQIMAVTAHYGNWEYLATMPFISDYSVLAIYKPLKNKYFDRFIQRNRNKYGIVSVQMEKIARTLISYSNEDRLAMTFFIADQRPQFHNIQYWTKFMGLDTPLYLGTEKLARKLDAAVVFFKVKKVKRGRYTCEIEMICEDPGKMAPYEITEAHVRILENMIREAPEYWLWSHKRWKHSYERYLLERS